MQTLGNLFFVFFKIGAVTFGGGYAMIPILERELAEKRSWTTKEQLLDYYAIAQSTPGMIAVNVATFLGYNQKGIVGAVIATFGVVCPSVIVITLIAAFLGNFAELVYVQKALRGINIAVAVLLTQATINFIKASVTDIFSLLLLLLSFTAMIFFNVPTVAIILVSAALGIGIKTCLARKICSNNKEDKN